MPKQPADALGEAIRTVSLDMAANIGCKVLEALARLAATMEMPPQGSQSVSLCLLTKAEEVERKLLGADATVTILCDAANSLREPVAQAAE